MSTIFVVQHIYQLDDDCESIKLVGVYSSRERAEAAVRRLAGKPGFCQFPNIVDPENVYEQGFEISESVVGRDAWVEGFVTYHYTREPS